MKIIDRIVASLDIVDSYFVQSNLKEIYQTDRERCETASMDALGDHQGTRTARERRYQPKNKNLRVY